MLRKTGRLRIARTGLAPASMRPQRNAAENTLRTLVGTPNDLRFNEAAA